MKKILVLSPFNIFPPYWGGASRIYNLTKYLGKKNKIVLLCNDYKQVTKTEINCKEFDELSQNPNIKFHFVKSLGRGSQIFNPLLVIEGLKIIRKERPDFVMAEFVWSSLHAMIFKFLCRVPYFLDEHNIEFLRFERMKRGNEFARIMLRAYEKVSCVFASKILCVSEVDRNHLISKLGIKKEKIAIIPNGVDTNKFYPNAQKRLEIRAKLNLNKEPVVLFFGKLDYKPNYEAIKIIRHEILPKVIEKILKIKFLIVGDNPPLEYSHENILFTGMVENIEDYINASDIVICPLLSGGGTRIKILEALACGKVVVSTEIGAEGLVDKEINDFLKIRNGWKEFSNEIVTSISENSSKPRKKFISIYSWDKIIKNISNQSNG